MPDGELTAESEGRLVGTGEHSRQLRIMVRRILRKYKYPSDRQEVAVELVLLQAKALVEA